ncbi:MAG: hypothetical protein AAGF79_01755, partial [Pseudomonadota bacterium]
CNQVEMSPGLQSRSVIKGRDGSKAWQPGGLKYRRAEKPCGTMSLNIANGMFEKQLHPDVAEFVQCLLRIERIPAEHREEFWLSKIVRVRVMAENSDGRCVETFLDFFGGMGSFSDLVLNVSRTADDISYQERKKAYLLAQKLK